MADLRERIADQFSGRGERADVWRVLDLVVDADAFLNLGYSRRFQAHFVGSSQRRLAAEVGRTLAGHLPAIGGVRLLDVGCGRGGPAVHLADRFGFAVVGVDLVPHNVARARETARAEGVAPAEDGSRVGDAARAGTAEFVVGDAARLPVAPESVAAAVSVDALVYLPDREAVLSAVADALEPGGVLVFTDLLARPDLDAADRQAVAAFAEAWDMPPPGSRRAYERAIDGAGLGLLAVEDLTPHSVGRFRKWTTLYGLLRRTPAGRLVDRLLARRGVDAATVDEQIRRAHAALPALEHRLLVAERPA